MEKTHSHTITITEKTPTLKVPPKHGDLITILSIDGGGIRGIIPGVILSFLESQLQELDGENVRLADYFDVITGTSTGGLITTMITSPNEKSRPLYAANGIVPFYLKHSPNIFPKPPWWKPGWVISLMGPKYDGDYLHKLLRDELGEKRLHECLTNVVIPTFDITKLEPVLFSSYKLENEPFLDALLSDICISTTAAPTFFPPYYFENKDKSDGHIRKFNLIDGGITDNNPTLVAITEVTKEVIIKENPDFFQLKKKKGMDYKRLLVISLGAGSFKNEHKYTAAEAAKWGVIGWLKEKDNTPIIDAYDRGKTDMVDYHNSVVFEAYQSSDNYLRIQDDTLTGTTASTDDTSEKNLKDLVKVGENLLKKPVSRMNPETGDFEPIPNADSNEDALKWFAQQLSAERKLRLKTYALS